MTVPQIRVSVSPASALIPVGAQQEFAATVQYDPEDAGVTWSLVQGVTLCSPACGAIVAVDAVTSPIRTSDNTRRYERHSGRDVSD